MVANSTDRFNGVIAAQAIKTPCKAVAIANITLSGEQTVNSVAVVADDRVLATAQTDSIENGIYDVSTGAWARSADWDGNRDVVSGTFVTVATATVGRNPYYQVTTADPIIVGTTAVNFTLADGPNVSYPITADEVTAGLTTSDIDDSFPELHVLRYGSDLNATTLQAAIDYWIDKAAGKLDLAGLTFNTGSTEVVVDFDTENKVPMIFEGNGAIIAPSATIDLGNGYGLKITRGALVLVRNKVFQNFDVQPTAGDCGGIEIDGRDNANGFLYNLAFNAVHVDTVTKHGMFLGGNFFESTFNECSVRIPTNETGIHCIAVDEDGNDDAAGDISSITLNDCNLSGGENNVNLNGAGDSIKCDDGTYVLSGKESIKGSSSGHLEFNVENIHFEDNWNGAAAVKSASWVAGTNQAVIDTVGRGTIRDCRCVSSTDAVRQIVRVHATGAFLISGTYALENGAVGDFEYVVRAEGVAAGRININSSEITGVNQVDVVDTNAAGSVHWSIDGCPDGGDKRGPVATESVITTNVITPGETGKTFLLDLVGGFTSTLPAPADGLNYKFIVKTAATTAYIITTNGGDNILQGAFLDIVGELVPITAQDTLNFVASTALAGDRLEVESDGTSWFCWAFSKADGGITVSVT